MIDSLPTALLLALSGLFLVFALQRPRQNALRGHVGFAVEVFASVIVAVVLVYVAVFPALHWLGTRLP